MKAKQRPFLAERRAKGQRHAKLAPSDREASAAGEAVGGGGRQQGPVTGWLWPSLDFVPSTMLPSVRMEPLLQPQIHPPSLTSLLPCTWESQSHHWAQSPG